MSLSAYVISLFIYVTYVLYFKPNLGHRLRKINKQGYGLARKEHGNAVIVPIDKLAFMRVCITKDVIVF